MRPGILRNPLFAARLRAPRPGRSEPRLLPRDVVQPVGPSPVADGTSDALKNEKLTVPASPTAPRSSIAPAAAACIPVGTLLFLGLVGLIAVAISASFGAGFFLLAAPANEAIAASGRNPPHPPQGDLAPGPTALEAGSPPVAEIAANRDLFPSGDVAQMPPNTVKEPLLPAPPGAASLALTVPTGQASSSAPLPTNAAPGNATSKGDPVADSGSASSGYDRPAHARIAARHVHSRSAGDSRSAPSPSRFPRSLTPSQAERAASFGQLLTHLTGKTRTSAETLTPPAAGTATPFAERAAQ